jgi:putative ABC transport system ATP-binding protein
VKNDYSKRRNAMEAVLEARDLAKTYHSQGTDVLALRGVDFVVAPGEFVAVMGPSGCGKSTLLNLLGGLDRPTAGRVLLAGERIDTLGEAKRAILRRRRIGLVFQFFNLIPNLTVAENVELPARLVGSPQHEASARREELLARLGLADKPDALPAQLSGGEQQRVAIARALVNRPAVLLADEPTGNLDSASTRDVLELLRQARDEARATVLVTHNARVASAADRVVSLRDGLVVDETRLDEGRDTSLLLSQLVSLEA